VPRTLLEAIGYKLGVKAAQAKNAFDLMGGSEEDSLRAEIRLGRDLANAVLQHTPLVEENETTRFVAQIGRWLAAHVKERPLPFAVRVIWEEQPNAFALPGGPVFVTWPMVELCQPDRDEVAFILAHEMAHIVRRHTLERMVQDAAVSLLLRHSSGASAAKAWLSKAGTQVLGTAFSADNELEADRFAAALVGAAGGDPLAGTRLLERWDRTGAEPALRSAGPYFGTHPSLADRLANLRPGRLTAEAHAPGSSPAE
jgi:predicted Zn-dependent protease